MARQGTSYDARARAPARYNPARSSNQLNPSLSEQSSASSSLGRGTLGRQARRSSNGPEFQPLTLTAYEHGKRSQRREFHEDSSSMDSSSDDSTGDDSDDTSEDEKSKEMVRGRGSSKMTMYLLFGFGFIVLFAAAVFLYRSQSTLASSSSTSLSTSSPTPTDTSSFAATSRETAATLGDDSSSQTSPSPTNSDSSSQPSNFNTSSSDSIAKSTASPSSKSAERVDANNGAPSEYSGITLEGTFVDTASYAVATGTAGYVGDEKANADMSKIEVEPNHELVKDKTGKIWIGDTTFYAAGKGGYGSCGTKLYDGQDLHFAAMSVYDLMGSASPSPFCYSCISLQNTKDPSKMITAIVADSCPACTLAHVDLEQKAFFALGATVEMGVLTVAWSFTDCPEGWSKEELEKTSESVYEELES
ncbi:RlpA-like double-psi beta-barrel domain-containing protein [Sporobolomyces salmoneus]|uniref:RlpA-like double-psi beta-barrel domain-containing protein n=1 Tax=Sporobolomyces salmoneus TaxID=183962 RepID=UPI0031718951